MKHKKTFFRILILLFAFLSMASCTKPVEEEKQIDEKEESIPGLERLCSQLNANLTYLAKAVTALESKDYIIAMSPVEENGMTIGYAMNFNTNGSIILYQINSPQFGVAQNSDGLWYWTLDGQWLKDNSGQKISTKGIRPQMKTNDNYWFVSIDEGKSWNKMGLAKDANALFKSITQDNMSVYITFADGTVLTLPKEQKLSVAFDSEDLIVMGTNASRDIHYTIASPYEVLSVEVSPSLDLQAKVVPDSDLHTGIVHVETGDSIDENTKLTIFVTDGYKLLMRSISFEQEELAVKDGVSYRVGGESNTLHLDYLSNVDCIVEIPEPAKEWLSESATKAVIGRQIYLDVAHNPGFERETDVWVSTPDGRYRVQYHIYQSEGEEIKAAEIERERAILTKWYQETGGDNWNSHENWCSDEPLINWEGIYTSSGYVHWISLPNNNMTGVLPEEIWSFRRLKHIYIPGNNLEIRIPDNPDNLSSSLEEITLGNYSNATGKNCLVGGIPPSIAKFEHLKVLYLPAMEINGTIPEELWSLPELELLDLGYNRLEGEISPSVGKVKKIQQLILSNNRLYGPIPKEFGELKMVDELRLGNVNHLSGVDIILDWNNLTGNLPEELADATSLTDFWVWNNRLSGALPERILKCERAAGWHLEPQQPGYGFTYDIYESKDYSHDGNVVVLQRATQGKGIDLVVMGDAFADTDLADGTYGQTMLKIVENFFAIEPYSSFKDYFNVYMVEVVSPNSGYGPGAKGALGTVFSFETLITGNDARCFEYAKKAVGEERMDEVLVAVAMNREYYAGTCYMYYPEEGQGNYGNGPAVSYFPLGTDADMFRGLIQHEAGGHGFAKLDDEYDYGETVPQKHIEERTPMFDWGWWNNIDFTADSETIKWSHFLSDDRYASEGLGIFEGGSTFGKGVWRPTENSIMRYNTGTYNAPSREAIYKRINKLAYGAEWEYDYESFVSYDAINRVTTKSSWGNWRKYDALARPVFTGKSWREASDTPAKAKPCMGLETLEGDGLTITTKAPEEKLPSQ